MEIIARLGKADNEAALDKFLHSVNDVKSANHLNSKMTCMSVGVKNGEAGREKIPCHPTSIPRRSSGRPK